MGKIKRVWNENRVLLVLGIVLLACIGIMVGVAIVYGYGSHETDIDDKANINEKVLVEAKEKLEKNESVKSASAKLNTKIVYLNIEFNEGTKVDDAKKVAEESLSVFSDDDLKECDIQLIITNGTGFTIMGAKNRGSNALVWGNYNTDYLKEEKETNEKK